VNRAGQVDPSGFAELVGEVGLHDGFLGLLQDPPQTAQLAAAQLQHRQHDVDPPVVAGDLVEQNLLRGNGRIAV
jgi:hypothetical protein